jgi:predicted CopG family antitoxin
MDQQLSQSQAHLQCSQILELPDLLNVIKVSAVDDFDDDASFTMEDLMDMDDKVKDEKSPTYKKDTNRSHDKFILGRKEQKEYQKCLASCPEFKFEETKTTDSPRKHKSSKKRNRTREAPSRAASCNAAATDQRGNTLVRSKGELREARAAPSRSFSCIAVIQTGEVKKTTLSRQKKERQKTQDDPLRSIVPLHSSFSRTDFEKGEDLRRSRVSSINAHQVEFGSTFSPIAHASGLHKKIDKNDESFSDVLDKVAKWKRTTKRDDRLSMRATRSIDIEEEEDVKKVANEEVSALNEKTKREETTLAQRRRSSRKERSAEPAEIPFERRYMRKKSLRNLGGSLKNVFASSSNDPNGKNMSFRAKSGSSRNLRTQPSDDSKPTSCKPGQAETLPPKHDIENYLGQAFIRHLSRQLSKSQTAF